MAIHCKNIIIHNEIDISAQTTANPPTDKPRLKPKHRLRYNSKTSKDVTHSIIGFFSLVRVLHLSCLLILE